MSKSEIIKLCLQLIDYCYINDADGFNIEWNGVIMNFSYEVTGDTERGEIE